MTTTERKAAGQTTWTVVGKYIEDLSKPQREQSIAEFYGPDRRENIARAVRAVNSHDDLMAALEAIVNDSPPRLSIRLVNLEKARAAIAKAKAQ